MRTTTEESKRSIRSFKASNQRAHAVIASVERLSVGLEIAGDTKMQFHQQIAKTLLQKASYQLMKYRTCNPNDIITATTHCETVLSAIQADSVEDITMDIVNNVYEVANLYPEFDNREKWCNWCTTKLNDLIKGIILS